MRKTINELLEAEVTRQTDAVVAEMRRVFHAPPRAL